MAKGRKRTKGLRSSLGMPMYHEPTHEERIKNAAKNFLSTVAECSPEMEKMTAQLAKTARRGVSKVIRAAGKGKLEA